MQPDLGRYAQKDLENALRKLVLPSVRAAAPISSRKSGTAAVKPSGTLRKSVKVARARKRPREMGAAWVGVRGGKRGAFYGAWVIRGTKAHALKPRGSKGVLRFGRGGFTVVRYAQHPGSRKNPFVGRSARGKEAAVVKQLLAGVMYLYERTGV